MTKVGVTSTHIQEAYSEGSWFSPLEVALKKIPGIKDAMVDDINSGKLDIYILWKEKPQKQVITGRMPLISETEWEAWRKSGIRREKPKTRPFSFSVDLRLRA